MVRAAEWLRDALLKSGANRAEVMPTEGNPVVFAEKIIDRSLPTVLVYGHYDVMPEDPVDEWRTEPFEPVVKEGRIWCRGADDDKGQALHARQGVRGARGYGAVAVQCEVHARRGRGDRLRKPLQMVRGTQGAW